MTENPSVDLIKNMDVPFASLETIVVTTNKRDESLLETPLSVTVVNEQALQDSQIDSITGIGDHVPGMHAFTWGGVVRVISILGG